MGYYFNCLKCNKPFYASRYKRKYCSKDCSNKANARKLSQSRIGEANPMYGKRPWNYIDGGFHHRKINIRYNNWRQAVFNKDKQICQSCNKILNHKDCIAHHIKSWSDFPKLRFDVDNGITYCRPCHNKIEPNIIKNQYRIL